MEDLVKRIKTVFSKKETIYNASEAYYMTMYGQNLTREEVISIHISQINTLIKSKMEPELDTTLKTQFSSHYCVYDIPEDIEDGKDEILKPFIDKGYNITLISDKVDNIKSKNLFLISWDIVKPKQDNQTKQ